MSLGRWVFCYVFLVSVAFPSVVAAESNFSLEEIRAMNNTNREFIEQSASYSYNRNKRPLSGEQNSHESGLFRRKGEKVFSLRKLPNGSHIEVVAFDGNVTSRNDFSEQFANSFFSGENTPFQDVRFYEHMLEQNKKDSNTPLSKRPGDKPFGQIIEGLEKGRDVGLKASDYYLQGAFYTPNLTPPLSYAEILANSTATITRRNGDLVTIHVALSPSIQCDVTVDTAKGCLVSEFRMENSDTGRSCVVRNSGFEKDARTGAWYPTSHEADYSPNGWTVKTQLLSMSFEETVDVSFSELWFDGQQIRDTRVNETHFFLLRDPREYDEDMYLNALRLAPEERVDLLKREAEKELDGVVAEMATTSSKETDRDAFTKEVSTPISPATVGDTKSQFPMRLVIVATVILVLASITVGYWLRKTRG